MWSSFAYHEPSATQLIILLSFLLFLNVGGKIAQKLLSAGLLGQILVGIIYGTPLAGILLDTWEEAIVAIGYVGLLLVVFEGGMSSSISNLKTVLPIAVAVALTGLLTPIALSFILIPLSPGTALHAFAAGSALSSTSLGTVLAVLHPSTIGFDLRRTGLGTALLSAAVMDDIVAFILVKVLNILGTSEETSSSYLGRSIGRAVGVTIALGVVLALCARFILRPLYRKLKGNEWAMKNETWGGRCLLVLILSALFIGMVAAAGYGGTSPLYGSYIAGLTVAYVSEEDMPDQTHPNSIEMEESKRLPIPPTRQTTSPAMEDTPHDTQPEPSPSSDIESQSPETASSTQHGEGFDGHAPIGEYVGLIETFEYYITPILTYLLLPLFFGSIGYSIPFVPLWRGKIIWRGIVYAILMLLGKVFCGVWLFVRGWSGWRAVLILGLAMISRGEIGLLIAQVARGTEGPLLDEDEFLIVVWAIVLCTIIGPMSVGWAVKRWKRTILRGGWD